MAGRGRNKEVSIQTEIENQEEWEEQLAKEGLLVVDVFQDWCGPCKPMLPVFKRINNESGDDLLRFATAKADTIDALCRYKGKCQPHFLLYAGGVLVGTVHGANGPGISKAIADQLTAEHSVLETGGTRVEVVDTKYPMYKKTVARESAYNSNDSDSAVDEQSTDEEEEERNRLFIEKEMALLIVAPMLYHEKISEEIGKKLRGASYDVALEQEIVTSEEELCNLLPNYIIEDKIEAGTDTTQVATGYIFVISKGEMGKNILQEIKEFVGPESYSLAIEFSPASLRAVVGTKTAPLCGLIIADNLNESKSMIKHFLPTYIPPSISVTNLRAPLIYTTVAYVRPALYESKPGNLFSSLQDLSFKVILKKEVHLQAEFVYKLYKHLSSEDYYETLVESMLSGPCQVLLINNNLPTVVNDFKEALGPFKPIDNITHLRGKFQVADEPINQLDCSVSKKTADKEKKLFFPMDQSILLIKPSAFDFKDQILNTLKDENYIIAARKYVTLTDEQISSLYAPYKSLPPFKNILQSLNKTPSCFLVLSRLDGLDRLKALLGYKTKVSEVPEGEEEGEEEEEEGGDADIETIMRRRSISTSQDNFNDLFNTATPKYYPDQFENLSQVFGLHLPDSCLHIADSNEESVRNIEEIFGPLKFHKDGFVRKAKKIVTTKICETKAPKISTYEEVYKEVDELPRLVKVKEEEVDGEYERQREEFLRQELAVKEQEKDEAKDILDATYLEEAGTWGTVLEYPVKDENNTFFCCPEQVGNESRQSLVNRDKNDSKTSENEQEISLEIMVPSRKLTTSTKSEEDTGDDKGKDADDEGGKKEEEEEMSLLQLPAVQGHKKTQKSTISAKTMSQSMKRSSKLTSKALKKPSNIKTSTNISTTKKSSSSKEK